MVKQIATQPHDGIFLSNKKKNEGMIHITRRNLKMIILSGENENKYI